MVKLIGSLYARRYLIIAVIGVLSVSHAMIYFKGRMDVKNSLNAAMVKKTEESIRATNDVRTVVQSKNEIDLNNYLCQLGIVRMQDGCQ